jgi:DNA-directed RNA polymerase specialized sigma24 family protein
MTDCETFVRAVLVLRYYQQLTDPEIADVLGCSAITVRGYAHRVLATLRIGIVAELASGAKEI